MVVQRLERWSAYHHLTLQSASSAAFNPVLYTYRILDLREEKYHVLSRIQDVGLDFTRRSNHLAHHLVFSSADLLDLPSPATILLLWPGWRSAWDGLPRLLAPEETQGLSELKQTKLLPARNWQQVTGDAASAAGFLALDHRRLFFEIPPGQEQVLLALYAEALQLLDPVGQSPLGAWQYPFTTVLQAEDPVSEFHWRGAWTGTPGYDIAIRAGLTPVAPASISARESDLAYLARHGRLAPSKVEPPPAAPKITIKPQPKPRGFSILLPPAPSAPKEAPARLRINPRRNDLAEFEKLDRLHAIPQPKRSSSSRVLLFSVIMLLVVVGLAVPRFLRHRSTLKEVVFKSVTNSILSSLSNHATNASAKIEYPPHCQVFFTPLAAIPTDDLTNHDLFIRDLFTSRPDDLGMLECKVFFMDSESGLKVVESQVPWEAKAFRNLTGSQPPRVTVSYSIPDKTLTFQTPSDFEPAMVGIKLSWRSKGAKEGSTDTCMDFVAITKPSRIPTRKGPLAELLKLDSGAAPASILDSEWAVLLKDINLPPAYHWCFVPYVTSSKSKHWLFQGWDPDDLPAMGEELNFSNLNAKLSNPAGAGNAHWQMVTNALTFKYQWETNSFPPFQEFCAKPNRSERGAPIAEEFVNYIRSCAEEITKKDTNFVSKLGGDVKLIQEGDLLVKCGGGAKECYDILASHSNEFKNENWRGCKEIAQRLLKRSERKAVFNRIVGGGWNEITAVELWICSDDGQHTRHPRNDAKSVDYLICVFSAKTK
jgi:hypothetical protein